MVKLTSAQRYALTVARHGLVPAGDRKLSNDLETLVSLGLAEFCHVEVIFEGGGRSFYTAVVVTPAGRLWLEEWLEDNTDTL